ncbi:MAG TPA: hypothetical protein V6C69_17005 [Trichormus sp.]|jgi:hypothetical protein
MRKHTTVLILLLCQGLYCLPGSRVRAAEITVVPSGTKIRVALSSSFDSSVAKDDTPIAATTLEAIEVDGTVAIPKGSQLSGRMIKLDRNQPGPYFFALSFDRITAANGQIGQPVVRACDRGGILKVSRGGQLLDFAVATRITCAPQTQATIFLGHKKDAIHLQEDDEIVVELQEDLRY